MKPNESSDTVQGRRTARCDAAERQSQEAQGQNGPQSRGYTVEGTNSRLALGLPKCPGGSA